LVEAAEEAARLAQFGSTDGRTTIQLFVMKGAFPRRALEFVRLGVRS
jgi:hypothetical protein